MFALDELGEDASVSRASPDAGVFGPRSSGTTLMLVFLLVVVYLLIGYACGRIDADHACKSAQDAADAAAEAAANAAPTLSPLAITAVSGDLNNLYVGSVVRVTWTWTRAGLVSISAPGADISEISLTASGGSALLTCAAVATITVTVVAKNPLNTAECAPTVSSSASIFVQCIEASVELATARGAVRADAVAVGDAMLQPDGSVSRVLAVRESVLQEGMLPRDRRLFADASGRVVVTAFHALSLQGPPTPAGSTEAANKAETARHLLRAYEHPLMDEIVRPQLPARVYHFVLERPADLLNVAGTTAWLESLQPTPG